MGVPRFFRWVAERWPCVLQSISVDSTPPTDNLFLNLNNILTEAAAQAGGHGDTTAIMEHVETCIEKLVGAIKPQSLVFLSIDGVIPKAKIIRHRSNKFRVAENMKLASAAAARRGEILKTFDLNALTAGTEFMMELVRRLKSFVQRKVNQDNIWPSNVIISEDDGLGSGSDVAGEAEHKILDYIRSQKCSPEWAPNQRHGFYGLDASTLMSALVIHEPHCYLLKEKSTRAKGSKGPAARAMLENNQTEEFVGCSIGLLRDYLSLDLKSQLPRDFQLDIERAVDDFALLCVISGSDFLPGLETFSGVDCLMENLMESYAAMLPSLEGYLTQLGRIDGERLRLVLEHCSSLEEDRVRDQLKLIGEGIKTEDSSKIDQEFLFVSNRAARDIFNQSRNPDDALHAWKERHYREKLRIHPSEKAAVVKQYFDGLNWSMRCLYRGTPSWSWFYPYHYSPLISDMKEMDPAKVLFKMGSPASMLFHLMSVVPRASYRLVPKILQPLITDSKSPLVSYYPNDCHIDLEGKRQDWDAVVLLPFPDDKKLGNILSRISQSRLSEDELERLKSGHSLLFSSKDGLIRVHLCPSDAFVPPAANCRDPIVQRRCQDVDSCCLSSLKAFHSKLPDGTVTGVDAPNGYWTLHSLKVTAALRKSNVCLFSYPSEKNTLQLTLPSPIPPRSHEDLIGKTVFVEWPSLFKARVVRVEDKDHITEKIIDGDGSTQSRRQTLTMAEWASKTEPVSDKIMEKRAIRMGQVDILVTVKRIEGAVRRGLEQLTEKYGPEQMYPLQAIITDNVYPNHDLDSPYRQKLALFPHDRLLCIGEAFPGAVVTILDDETTARTPSTIDTPLQRHPLLPPPLSLTDGIQNDKGDGVMETDDGGELCVSVQAYSERSMASLKSVQMMLRMSGEVYCPSGSVATRLGVTPQGLSRITGSLWVNTGNERQEIGLAVKLGSKNMCVAGYVRPSSNGTGWEYTEALISILESYKSHFYWVFEAVDATPEGGEINLPAVFSQSTENELLIMVRRTKQWLNTLPLVGRPLVTADARVGSIASIQQALEMLSLSTRSSEHVMARVPRSLLIPPADKSTIRSLEAGGEMLIGDFVSYIGSSLISFGSSGVVIGTLFDQVEVLFCSKVLQSISIFGDSTKQCSCLIHTTELVNISRLTGEDRRAVEHSSMKVAVHLQRTKNKSSSRSPGPRTACPGSARRKGKSNWSERGRHMSPHGVIFRHTSPQILDPSCAIRPVVPVPAYGSGVYIPGMTTMPTMQGNIPTHPMPYINYPLAHRY